MKKFRSKDNFRPAQLPNPYYIVAETDYDIISYGNSNEYEIKYYTGKNAFIRVLLSENEISQHISVNQQVLTFEKLSKILKHITFKKSCVNLEWDFEIQKLDGVSTSIETDSKHISGFLVSVLFTRPDINTGQIGVGKGREMWISEYASIDSVVKTIWVSVNLIIQHEMLESYQFGGATIFDPHKNLIELAFPKTIQFSEME